MKTKGNGGGNGFLRFQGTPGYIASGPLVDAVNAAIALERPLLLKGEPGTGKTVLARHVAEGLGMPMIAWHVKSTSKAADGLDRAVWLNPEDRDSWPRWHTTRRIGRLFPMFPLNVDGLTQALQALVGARV